MTLLEQCAESLACCRPLLLELLCTLAQDAWPAVSRPCQQWLADAQTASGAQVRMLTFVPKTKLHHQCTRLQPMMVRLGCKRSGAAPAGKRESAGARRVCLQDGARWRKGAAKGAADLRGPGHPACTASDDSAAGEDIQQLAAIRSVTLPRLNALLYIMSQPMPSAPCWFLLSNGCTCQAIAQLCGDWQPDSQAAMLCR